MKCPEEFANEEIKEIKDANNSTSILGIRKNKEGTKYVNVIKKIKRKQKMIY